jgi:hypothetical protein
LRSTCRAASQAGPVMFAQDLDIDHGLWRQFHQNPPNPVEVSRRGGSERCCIP